MSEMVQYRVKLVPEVVTALRLKAALESGSRGETITWVQVLRETLREAAEPYMGVKNVKEVQ